MERTHQSSSGTPQPERRSLELLFKRLLEPSLLVPSHKMELILPLLISTTITMFASSRLENKLLFSRIREEMIQFMISVFPSKQETTLHGQVVRSIWFTGIPLS